MANAPHLLALTTKPDFARCMERIEAWFHQAVLDRQMPREGVFLCLGVQEGAELETLKRVERWGK
jgi:hypothetical protein